MAERLIEIKRRFINETVNNVLTRLQALGQPEATRVRELEGILREEPQFNVSGLKYLVTSGVAVELITGYSRHHDDLDIVILDPKINHNRWETYIHAVTPDCYFGRMNLDGSFLKTTAMRVTTRRDGRGMPVYVVHPGVMLVQKNADDYSKPPRTKDYKDVQALVRFWLKGTEVERVSWFQVIYSALSAIPKTQRGMVQTRLCTVIDYELGKNKSSNLFQLLLS